MTPDLEAINQKISQSNKKLFQLFESNLISEQDIHEYQQQALAQSYMVAITPRSGSSYLCDLLEKTQLLGRPDEWLNPNLMPSMLQTRPASNVVKHLINMRKVTSTKNNVFGLKASFFQFVPMIDSGLDKVLFNDFKVIALFRKNILLQAISLYIAAETDVFHTNISHSAEKLAKVDSFDYDNGKLLEWIKHIYMQELGWKKYLSQKVYITIYYEDLIKDVPAYVKKVSEYLGISIEHEINAEDSVFKKLGFDRSESIYNQFMNNKKNVDLMGELGISSDRYTL